MISRYAPYTIALVLLVTASVIWRDAVSIASVPGYDRVGPRLFPFLVAGGMVLISLWLALDAAAGRWPLPSEPVSKKALALISIGLLLNAAFFRSSGFILAAAILFVTTARAFGSVRPFRDLLVGLSLAGAAFAGFDWGLDIALPAGNWLDPFGER